ncbi:MAG: hypothetical protein D8H96_16095 [Lautropia sp.]|nr:MAG: hypothetical protein D8H96_16095 [Lautropia sp.]
MWCLLHPRPCPRSRPRPQPCPRLRPRPRPHPRQRPDGRTMCQRRAWQRKGRGHPDWRPGTPAMGSPS